MYLPININYQQWLAHQPKVGGSQIQELVEALRISVAHYGEYIAHVRPCLESTVVGLKFCYCGHCSLELENTCDELKNLF